MLCNTESNTERSSPTDDVTMRLTTQPSLPAFNTSFYKMEISNQTLHLNIYQLHHIRGSLLTQLYGYNRIQESVYIHLYVCMYINVCVCV